MALVEASSSNEYQLQGRGGGRLHEIKLDNETYIEYNVGSTHTCNNNDDSRGSVRSEYMCGGVVTQPNLIVECL